MVETWRDVVGYEGRYRVSNRGNVWSCLTNRLLHQQPTWQGRLQVTLVPATGRINKRTLSVSRLVLEAFVGPAPEDKPFACHYDDNKANNSLENLRWDTQSANMQDMLRNGHSKNANKTHCPQGHEYTPENTRIKRGGRMCRVCDKLAARNRRKSKKSEVV